MKTLLNHLGLIITITLSPAEQAMWSTDHLMSSNNTCSDILLGHMLTDSD